MVLAALVVASGCRTSDDRQPPPLAERELDVLARIVGETVAGRKVQQPDPLPARLASDPGPVYVALRSDGERVGSDWGFGDSAFDAAVEAASAAFSDVRQPGPAIDGAELCLSRDFRPVSIDGHRLLTNVHRGVLGLMLEHDGSIARYSPTHMLANNWEFSDVIDRFLGSRGITDRASADIEAQVFSCDQVLVDLEDRPRGFGMERGNALVPLSAVSEDGVDRFGRLLGEWLTNQVSRDGRMTYKYWPSATEQSTANNTVRQWMATVALERFAAARGKDADLYELAAKNIRYNLENLYHEEDGFGLVAEEDGEVKLGAVAIAALAIVEHPQRSTWAREERALLETIDHLWQKDGSFRTFFRPISRNDNQNFYPGEALLLWATLYRENRDEKLLDRFMRSFRFYRDWHLKEANRNPAFVPWHTMADTDVWRVTRDGELRDFVLEMNDWLLEVQQWDDVVYPDLQGRFYDPDRPFGPPHASSTGVYLDGLIDAYTLAKAIGDDERTDRYRLAIRRGLRSVMQLQFADDVDMYYVTGDERDRVLGGLRTNPYDNEIRVDNVQHNLMAVLKIQERFDADDYTR
jgi:hypothetical protein